MSVKSVNEQAVARWEAGAASPEREASTAAVRTRALLFTNSVAVGGMEKHVELLARHLDRSRFEVFAISPEWEPTAAFSAALSDFSSMLAWNVSMRSPTAGCPTASQKAAPSAAVFRK